MKVFWFLFTLLGFVGHLTSQNHFNYSIELNPVNITNLPGLHSYAYAQHNGLWLVVGGRLDGLHARQPFNAFPSSLNNDHLYVIDVANQEFWSASLNSLPLGLKEQLQSTNMNFIQDNDTLYIIGGYAYSASLDEHITFPNLTSIHVSGLINAIVNNQDITEFFKQIEDNNFAVTGGQLGKIDNYFYLVGGHRFDGNYNPMNHPTFIQEYTDEIRKFTIDNSGSQLDYGNYSTLNDPVHLHRRDYNLLPQQFSNGTNGYTISSGVFQLTADLPYLYPVEMNSTGINPITSFNQYLSNYHSATANLYDPTYNEMYHLFFGGMSQYYYSNGTLVQDNLVPFVKTISLLVRNSDGSLSEFALPIEMPNLSGSSAEFIMNQNLPNYNNEILKLDEITENNFVIGYIFGGITSPTRNPFNSNQTSLTDASPVIYEVTLSRNPLELQEIDGSNPFQLTVYPNPTKGNISIQLNQYPNSRCEYFISDLNGKLIDEGILEIDDLTSSISLPETINHQALMLTLVIDNTYFLTQKLIISR